MSAKSFVYITFVCMLSFSIGIAGFNYLTDPFLIFGSKRIDGFNYFKTEINSYVALSKAYHPLHIPNETLILGNSRVEMGIDPDHQCFNGLGRAYNLGIPGQGVASQAAYAMNLIRQQPIKHIFWGLDFTDFLSTEQSISSLPLVQVKIGNSRLKYYMEGSLNDDYSMEKIKSYYKALFSLDALTRALKTVMLQSQSAATRTDKGYNPAHDIQKVTAVEGVHALFSQKLEELNKKYSKTWYLYDKKGETSQDFLVLKMFIELAREEQVTITLFSNPLHNDFWKLMKANNHFHLYEGWKKSLLKLVSKFDDTEVKFWNFSDSSEYLYEQVPKPGVKTRELQWFWEPAHYKKELGDLMVQTMLADQCDISSYF